MRGEIMKILIVVNSLQAGGAEKSALKLATSMSLHHHVILATLRNDLDHYSLPAQVHRVNFGDLFTHPYKTKINRLLKGKYRVGYNWVLKLRELRKGIIDLNVDAVIVFESLVGALISISLFQSNIPLVISERVNPDPQVYEPHKIARVLRPLIYRHGVVCTVQSKEFAKWCEDNWKIQPVVTPNHLLEDEYELSHKEKFEYRFVSIGRYSFQKGYETLLHSWQIVESVDSRARLEIFGAGNSDEYKELAKSLNLKRVFFHHAEKDMNKVYKSTDCLISASRFEGFPNVVLEALAKGVPVITTNSSPIINDLKDINAVQVVPIDDYWELARKVLGKCESGVSTKTRNRAFDIAREYNWSQVASTWETALKRAIEFKGLRARRLK
jgi:GalNAc-alpha-(1->4)-GalNAc-alpha-(1->3)-diNAcBac-PP-undecaprenol alpha-1,4-N-acetyl-D-galactosaminyltransferase